MTSPASSSFNSENKQRSISNESPKSIQTDFEAMTGSAQTEILHDLLHLAEELQATIREKDAYIAYLEKKLEDLMKAPGTRQEKMARTGTPSLGDSTEEDRPKEDENRNLPVCTEEEDEDDYEVDRQRRRESSTKSEQKKERRHRKHHHRKEKRKSTSAFPKSDRQTVGALQVCLEHQELKPDSPVRRNESTLRRPDDPDDSALASPQPAKRQPSREITFSPLDFQTYYDGKEQSCADIYFDPPEEDSRVASEDSSVVNMENLRNSLIGTGKEVRLPREIELGDY
jgi:hypothetical protein